MKRNKNFIKLMLLVMSIMIIASVQTKGQQVLDTLTYHPFVWESEPPDDIPFEQSESLIGIRFPGKKSGLVIGDTWYPTWADDDRLYSPYTDGHCPRLDGGNDLSISDGIFAGGYGVERTSTGQGVMEGDDPMTLKVYSLGITHASALPYHGRYPCGSLFHNGVWYYGTYSLDPAGQTQYGDMIYNWPWLGPFIGFRHSTDYGRTWVDTPHTPSSPIFGETGQYGHPVKIGAPKFVDFGKNMEYSPDGKAYLVAHGADIHDAEWRFHNASWITGDQIYLLRVVPSIENINNKEKYEFYGGKDDNGQLIWTNDFDEIKPLLEWNNNMGCVTITYNPVLRKYLMCITDGQDTTGKMNSYILEADELTGEWRLVTYLKDFGQQAYFLNIPSKFISEDGLTAWLLYSGNFTQSWEGIDIVENPPGSHYGLVFQKIEFLTPF